MRKFEFFNTIDVKWSLQIATVDVEVGGIRSLAPRIGGSKLIVCWAPRFSALRRRLARTIQEAIFRALIAGRGDASSFGISRRIGAMHG
jgi:hypothetical protein